jgi:intracellular multiplication protein IcmN
MASWIKRLVVLAVFPLILLEGCCCTQLGAPATWRHKPIVVCTLKDYIKRLKKQGVQVIKTGETFTISIPSDCIFYPDSANFNQNAILVLEPLVNFLRYYETTMMKITGYTDNQGSLIRNRVLSEKQAQALMDFLSKNKIDARLIYAVGYGPYHPIADNTIPSHSVQNRRIEIKFRKVVIPPLV